VQACSKAAGIDPGASADGFEILVILEEKFLGLLAGANSITAPILQRLCQDSRPQPSFTDWALDFVPPANQRITATQRPHGPFPHRLALLTAPASTTALESTEMANEGT
jgi:hypothetical protein